MASLAQAKDTIRSLDREIQLRTAHEVASKLTELEGQKRELDIRNAVIEIINETPDLTIDDANQLIAWQEEREEKWGSGEPQAAVAGDQ